MAGAAVLGRLKWHVGTAVALRDETATARTITFEVPTWPGHVAGQRVDIRVTAADGYAAVRSFSIASAPDAGRRIQLSVERLPDGEVSPYLTQGLAVGDRLELRGPIGGWFVWREDQTEPVQLIAGGSGIVPLMAMIRSRAAGRSHAPFRLLYSVRHPASVWYRDELQALSAERRALPSHMPTHVRLRPTLRDRPVAWTPGSSPRPAGPRRYRRRATSAVPHPFVEVMAGLLTAAGHPPDRIRTERFGPTGDPR